MFRLLRKPYLLRFKGTEILAHTVFVAVMFASITAMMRHPDLDGELILVILHHLILALFVAFCTFIPLRLAYRPIQRLPLYGAMLTGTEIGKQYEMGRYDVDGMTMYVSRGIGMEGMAAPRARFLCPPEIVCIDVHGSKLV